MSMPFFRKNTDEGRFARLESQHRELADAVDRLERQNKAMKLEWEEAYDKLHHLMARITKRALHQAKEDATSTAQNGSETEIAGNGLHTPSALPPVGTHARLKAMRSRHGLLPG